MQNKNLKIIFIGLLITSILSILGMEEKPIQNKQLSNTLLFTQRLGNKTCHSCAEHLIGKIKLCHTLAEEMIDINKTMERYRQKICDTSKNHKRKIQEQKNLIEKIFTKILKTQNNTMRPKTKRQLIKKLQPFDIPEEFAVIHNLENVSRAIQLFFDRLDLYVAIRLFCEKKVPTNLLSNYDGATEILKHNLCCFWYNGNASKPKKSKNFIWLGNPFKKPELTNAETQNLEKSLCIVEEFFAHKSTPDNIYQLTSLAQSPNFIENLIQYRIDNKKWSSLQEVFVNHSLSTAEQIAILTFFNKGKNSKNKILIKNKEQNINCDWQNQYFVFSPKFKKIIKKVAYSLNMHIPLNFKIDENKQGKGAVIFESFDPDGKLLSAQAIFKAGVISRSSNGFLSALFHELSHPLQRDELLASLVHCFITNKNLINTESIENMNITTQHDHEKRREAARSSKSLAKFYRSMEGGANLIGLARCNSYNMIYKVYSHLQKKHLKRLRSLHGNNNQYHYYSKRSPFSLYPSKLNQFLWTQKIFLLHSLRRVTTKTMAEESNLELKERD